MYKYSDNFFFTSNNILRFFPYIYNNVSAPPSALPVRILTKSNNFPPFSLRKKTLMRIFAALKNNGRPFRQGSGYCSALIAWAFFMPIILHTWRLPFREF